MLPECSGVKERWRERGVGSPLYICRCAMEDPVASILHRVNHYKN